MAILANRTAPLSQYVSNNILSMINQARGVRAYLNESWQECLNELDTAVQRDLQYPPDSGSPTVPISRSSEMLAMHLLLMHEKFQQQSVNDCAIRSMRITEMLFLGPSAGVQLQTE